MVLTKYNTETFFSKQITLREYQSPKIDCNDMKCRHVFPNCKTYYSISQSDQENQYNCLECHTGYTPLADPVQAEDFNLLYNDKKFI